MRLGKLGEQVVLKSKHAFENIEFKGYSVADKEVYFPKRDKRILGAIPYSDLRGMYRIMHEADISKFADTVDAILKEKHTETNLKRIRSARGLSQSQLAKKSGVSLRSIQMYEQRNKDINKGQAETLRSLAVTLGCGMENLLETQM